MKTFVFTPPDEIYSARASPPVYRGQRDVSQRTFYLEGTDPVEETGRPARGTPPSRHQEHAWEKRIWRREHWRPCRCSPHVQESHPRQVLHPVCGGSLCLRRR